MNTGRKSVETDRHALSRHNRVVTGRLCLGGNLIHDIVFVIRIVMEDGELPRARQPTQP